MKICSCGGKNASSGKDECERRAMESFSCFLQATGSRWSIEVTNWPVLNSCGDRDAGQRDDKQKQSKGYRESKHSEVRDTGYREGEHGQGRAAGYREGKPLRAAVKSSRYGTRKRQGRAGQLR